MMAIRPRIKARIPEAIPESMVRANAGLTEISFNIVSADGTDSYRVFVSEATMIKSRGIKIISAIDHLPGIVFGMRGKREI